jgi:lipoprotein-anchoring transpeptidase ErfK/SrfK
LREAEVLWEQQAYGLVQLRADQALEEARRARQGVAAAASRFLDPEGVARWRKWQAETVAWSKKTGKPAIVVDKDEGELTLFVRGQPVRRYPADLGRSSFNRKLHVGDSATPEGRYRVRSKKDLGQSRYHRALELDYPNDEDRERFARARRAGDVRAAHPGGLIMIHGDGGRGTDWTLGCVALSNAHIDDLFARVGVGTPVTIIGGDGRGRLATLARALEVDARDEADDSVDRE